jgi:iron complex transport system substrate-binding protein
MTNRFLEITMFRKTLYLTLLPALLLTACGSANAPSGNLAFTDSLGREVKLNQPAQRVVSLAPSNTEILYAVGAGSQVVGRDELSDYPAEVKSVSSVGGSMGDFNTEAIVSLEPDLVLASELNPPELASSLEGLGLTVYYLGNPETLEDMYTNLETVARLTGHENEAVDLVESLKSRVTAVDEKVAAVTEKPLVFYELDGTDPAKPWTSGPGTFIDQLIVRAVGVNAGAQLESEWAQISSEQLVAANPDIIILGDAVYGVTPDSVKARPGWDVLTAVKNDQIFTFDDNLVSRPGPRLVDAFEQLAKLLHPEVFQ